MPNKNIIDFEVFSQLLLMDDDDDHAFSHSLVQDFFAQATDTFTKLDKAIKAKDLAEVSRLGHFLKGSSAALGIKTVRNSCEKLQHYGKKRNSNATQDISESEGLRLAEETFEECKKEFKEAKEVLNEMYEKKDFEEEREEEAAVEAAVVEKKEEKETKKDKDAKK